MTYPSDAVTELSEDECWERLGQLSLGRLVTSVGAEVDIFPVNYAVDGHSVVFRTAEGTKLVELTVNSTVLFEVDDHTDADAWSVVLRGRAEQVEGTAEIAAAEALPLVPWIPTLKYRFVRVVASSVSGRSFERGPEPPRY